MRTEIENEIPDEQPSAPGEAGDVPPPPGQMPVITAALALGVLLMGLQIWLLTAALELYLAGNGRGVWQIALVSGAIFAGGLAVLWLLRRRPRARRPSPGESGEYLT